MQVVYLHGNLFSYRQRHTDNELSQPLPASESYLQESFKDGGLIIIGYRGERETPMNVLRRVIERRREGPGRGLYWVIREHDLESRGSALCEILRYPYVYSVPVESADDS
jgi:hypothetical protein